MARALCTSGRVRVLLDRAVELLLGELQVALVQVVDAQLHVVDAASSSWLGFLAVAVAASSRPAAQADAAAQDDEGAMPLMFSWLNRYAE